MLLAVRYFYETFLKTIFIVCCFSFKNMKQNSNQNLLPYFNKYLGIFYRSVVKFKEMFIYNYLNALVS